MPLGEESLLGRRVGEDHGEARGDRDGVAVQGAGQEGQELVLPVILLERAPAGDEPVPVGLLSADVGPALDHDRHSEHGFGQGPRRPRDLGALCRVLGSR